MKVKLILLATAAFVPLFMVSCDPGVYYGGGYATGGYVSSLPYGYSTVHVGGSPYYYHSNSWYRRSNGRYIRCARPHGYRGSLGRSSHRSHSSSYNRGRSYYGNKPTNHYRNYKPSSSSRGHSTHRGHSSHGSRAGLNPSSRSGSRSGIRPSISTGRSHGNHFSTGRNSGGNRASRGSGSNTRLIPASSGRNTNSRSSSNRGSRGSRADKKAIIKKAFGG